MSGGDEAENRPLEKVWSLSSVICAAGYSEVPAKAENQMRGGHVDGGEASKAICPAAILHDAFVRINDNHAVQSEL